MKIAILFANETNPYEGRLKPFINWAKEFSNDYEVYFVLFGCGGELVEFIGNMNNVQRENVNNFRELARYLDKVKPDIFLSDDYFQRLKLVSKVKDKIKTVVYVQILFATHSIMETFSISFSPLEEKLLFWILRFVPFSLLKRQYKKFLGKQDAIVANSKITATLLHILYGIEPDGIIYPPLDTNVFRLRNARKKNQVLLYLGSHAGDTDENFVKEICRILKNKNLKILVMGNKILREKLSKEFDISSISGVSDEELAKIYSENKLTICPQKWETFGYVPVESMACGTPVLSFDCMGTGETIINGRTGWLAKNKQEFLETLDSILENEEIQMDQDFIRRYVEENFSINVSVKELEEVFRGKIG